MEGATETRIDLPAAVDGDFEVYVNGIEQTLGTDYELDGRTLVFPRTLVAETKMTPRQWVLVTVGIGNYGKHDTVDVLYEHNGRKLVATGLRGRTESSPG